jgi:hypothetical protein
MRLDSFVTGAWPEQILRSSTSRKYLFSIFRNQKQGNEGYITVGDLIRFRQG